MGLSDNKTTYLNTGDQVMYSYKSLKRRLRNKNRIWTNSTKYYKCFRSYCVSKKAYV